MIRWGLVLLTLGGLCWAMPGTAQTAPSPQLTYDSATKTAATLVVPAGCIVVIDFVNLDGTPHSAELIPDKDPMPNMGGDPAIPGGYTRDLTQGLPQGEKDVLRFTAPPSGSLRIFCGVPGDGLSGMWIRFKVDPAVTAPSWKTS